MAEFATVEDAKTARAAFLESVRIIRHEGWGDASGRPFVPLLLTSWLLAGGWFYVRSPLTAWLWTPPRAFASSLVPIALPERTNQPKLTTDCRLLATALRISSDCSDGLLCGRSQLGRSLSGPRRTSWLQSDTVSGALPERRQNRFDTTSFHRLVTRRV